MAQLTVDSGRETPSVTVLANGLTLIFLPLPHVQYVSLDLLLPGGVAQDPVGATGSALVLAEMLSRGAGELSSEQLLSEFDNHGIRHSESSSLLTTSLRLSFLPGKARRALDLMSLMVQKPVFPDLALPPVKALFLHDLRSIRENPSRWAMLELARRYFPAPYNRSSCGEEREIDALQPEALRKQWRDRFGPKRAVLSVAGKFEVPLMREIIEHACGGWIGGCEDDPIIGTFPERGRYYLEFPGSQQQLVLKYPSVPLGHPLYYAGKVFAQLLSGGMFGRLFIEVREKRGLCYSVYAQHAALPEYGALTVYAGTTPERVHETHQVITDILADPLQGLTDHELFRAKNNLLSQIILSEESTSSRSRSNASDFLHLGRIRPLEEVQREVERVDGNTLTAFLKSFPLLEPATLTLGASNFGGWSTIEGHFGIEQGIETQAQ